MVHSVALTGSDVPTEHGAQPVLAFHEPWTGNKRQREALRQKFGGRCAYCGGELTDMHADHLEPVIRIQTDPWGRRLPAAECRLVKPERNTVANMMPACKACNLHKGGYSLEGWRDIIQRSGEIIAKQTSTFRAGVRHGVISVSSEPVRFYFENLANSIEAPRPGILPAQRQQNEQNQPAKEADRG